MPNVSFVIFVFVFSDESQKSNLLNNLPLEEQVVRDDRYLDLSYILEAINRLALTAFSSLENESFNGVFWKAMLRQNFANVVRKEMNEFQTGKISNSFRSKENSHTQLLSHTLLLFQLAESMQQKSFLKNASFRNYVPKKNQGTIATKNRTRSRAKIELEADVKLHRKKRMKLARQLNALIPFSTFYLNSPFSLKNLMNLKNKSTRNLCFVFLGGFFAKINQKSYLLELRLDC